MGHVTTLEKLWHDKPQNDHQIKNHRNVSPKGLLPANRSSYWMAEGNDKLQGEDTGGESWGSKKVIMTQMIGVESLVEQTIDEKSLVEQTHEVPLSLWSYEEPVEK